MNRLIAFAVALSVSSAAPAADWTFVANCGEPGQIKSYSYDRDSVRRHGRSVQVRVRGDYSRSAGSRTQEARILWSFDCLGRTFVERSRTEYGTGHKRVASYNKPTGSMGIVRGSITEKVYAAICA